MTVPAGSIDPRAAGDGTVEALREWEGRPVIEIARQWRVPRLEILRAVGSTNDYARFLAAQAAPEGTVILAERQEAGRGRAGRGWDSPPEVGLYLSVITRPDPTVAPTYPLRMAVAVAHALDSWTAGMVAVKWPNDLLLGGRKLGGILCEATWSGAALAHVIVGVGLNVLHRAADFPPDLRHAATSLLSVSDSVSRFEVATAVVAALTALIQDSHSGSNSGEWHAELTRRDVLFGRRIDVLEPESGRPLASGTADGIAEDGALRIRHDGNVMSIRSGTIRLAGDHPA